MKKVSVLQLITGLNVGGAEKVVFDLSRKLNPNDFRVFVVCISDKHKLLDDFRNAGINTTALDMTKHPLSVFRGIIKLGKFIRKENISIIHAHMTHSLVLSCLLKLMRPELKIIYTSHNSNLGSKYKEIAVLLSKPFRNRDIIFSPSMRSKIYLKTKSIVIPNGIDTSSYDLKLIKNEVFTFLSIGRLEYVKNHKALIDAAVKLKGEFIFFIDIVGEGILKEELERYSIEKGVSDIVRFLGYRKDVNTVCGKCHAFVLPSFWEGLPISLLEAGASLLPIISTPVGSIPELVTIENGYLVEADDFPNAMRSLYFDYQDALKRAGSLRSKIVQFYDLDSVTKLHERLYKGLI
jgi:glycosyltransferase involved in cell wall biosynthesis